MKKLVAFLTALTLLGSLTACDRNQTEVVPDPLPSASVSPTPTPTPAPSPTPPTADVALTYDPEELELWQMAYIQLLEGELERGEVGFAEGTSSTDMPRYYLCDMDKNGVPELILVYDGYYSGIVYTYQQNEVKALNKGTEEDSFWLVDSVLYSYPNGNGVLRYCASNAWSWQIGLYSLKDGELCFDILVQESSEEPLEEPIDVQDYYPDSRYLNDYSALVTVPERGINFLPIVNYPKPPKADRIPPKQQEQEEKLVQDVIGGDGWFYCVSEHNDDNMGWITLEDYCQGKKTTVSDTQWQDLNGDGVREAVLRLSSHVLILSAQDGVVYGYDTFMETHTLNHRTGTFEDRTRSNGYYNFRVYFAKNQYYETYYEGEVIFPRAFSHMSGVGGWSTDLYVAEDGSFEGCYFRHSLAEASDRWMLYFSEFSGKFSLPKKVNAYTYSVRLEALDIGAEKGGLEGSEDFTQVGEGAAPGIEGGEEFLIYLPGAPLDELPEDFLLWVKAPGGIEDDDITLPWCGLYNAKEQLGWFEGFF